MTAAPVEPPDGAESLQSASAAAIAVDLVPDNRTAAGAQDSACGAIPVTVDPPAQKRSDSAAYDRSRRSVGSTVGAVFTVASVVAGTLFVVGRASVFGRPIVVIRIVVSAVLTPVPVVIIAVGFVGI